MGIDVTFCNGPKLTEDDNLEGGERVASVGGFLNLAQMVGAVLESMPQIDSPEAREAYAGFEAYVEEFREQGEKRFRSYCEFLKELGGSMPKQEGGEPVWFGFEPESVDPENFEPDARVFFGRFVLGDEPISPSEADRVGGFIGMTLGLFTHYADVYKDDRPELSEALKEAYECLDIARNFCDQAIEDDRYIFFSS